MKQPPQWLLFLSFGGTVSLVVIAAEVDQRLTLTEFDFFLLFPESSRCVMDIFEVGTRCSDSEQRNLDSHSFDVIDAWLVLSWTGTVGDPEHLGAFLQSVHGNEDDARWIPIRLVKLSPESNMVMRGTWRAFIHSVWDRRLCGKAHQTNTFNAKNLDLGERFRLGRISSTHFEGVWRPLPKE